MGAGAFRVGGAVAVGVWFLLGGRKLVHDILSQTTLPGSEQSPVPRYEQNYTYYISTRVAQAADPQLGIPVSSIATEVSA